MGGLSLDPLGGTTFSSVAQISLGTGVELVKLDYCVPSLYTLGVSSSGLFIGCGKVFVREDRDVVFALGATSAE